MEEVKNKVFVGNLPYTLNDEGLKKLFDALEGAEVTEAKVVVDKFSGRSKGFGFVTFAKDEMAQQAIEKLNGHEVEGRKITIDFARPPRENNQ